MTRPRAGTRRAWRVGNYGLGIVLLLIFVVSLAGAAVAGWVEYAAEQRVHDRAPELLGADGYAWVLGEQVFQNWQSEFLALGLFIALAVALVHRGSPQSKDGHEERRRQIAELERRVEAMVHSRGPSAQGGTR